MDTPAARRPLDEAAEAIRRLDAYETLDELAAALGTVVPAIDRALRLRLRGDPDAPEHHRLTALSSDRLPRDVVVQSLRARDRISLETAGAVHQLEDVMARLREGETRPADADPVREAAVRLRRELPDGEPEGEPDSAAAGTGAGAAAGAAGPSDPDDADPRADTSAATGRWMAWFAAAVAALMVAGAAFVVLRGGNQDYDEAIAAFRAGRYDSAAVGFQGVLEDRPRDVSVMLYLGRVYRRLDRPAEAADVLQRAVAVDATDADVRRELGHLFLDLERPRSAVAQYERALESDPEDPLNWAALIRALRDLGDPRADDLLRDAPAEVQAALTGS